MPELTSRDGRYLLADQSDGNVVVYDLARNVPVWNKWNYEAAHGETPAAPPPVVPVRPDAPQAPLAPARVIRVTSEQDGDLVNRGYSYWSQAWVADGPVVVFVGHADGHPRFFSVHLMSGAIQRLGSLLPYTGTGEGWYWDAEGWIYLCDGPRLRRADPFTGENRVVIDISDTHPMCDLWQAHSSDDGRTHSATVRRIVSDGPYPKVGTVVFRDGVLRYERPELGVLDESAISGNGRYLLIKEGSDDDNRFVDLSTGTERIVRKSDGALGHSDMGSDWAIGDDRTVGGATWVNLGNPDDRRVLVRFPDWNMGHVSIKGGRCLLTHGDLITLLDPVTGFVTVLAAHGMTVGPGEPYDYQVNANLDPTGRVACWLSNIAGRMDLYVLPVLESP